MSSLRLPSPTVAVDGRAVRQRILRQARTHFFVHGYSTLTMADLATELGMSKKTLYVHFAGKDAIVGALIEDLGAEVRAARRHRRLQPQRRVRQPLALQPHFPNV